MQESISPTIKQKGRSMHALKANSHLNWMPVMTAVTGRRARRVLMPLVALAGASAIAAVETWSGAGADDPHTAYYGEILTAYILED